MAQNDDSLQDVTAALDAEMEQLLAATWQIDRALQRWRDAIGVRSLVELLPRTRARGTVQRWKPITEPLPQQPKP